MAALPPGIPTARNTTLNKEAYKLVRQYVVPGALDIEEIIEVLAAAALACGLHERQIKADLGKRHRLCFATWRLVHAGH